MKSKKLSLRHRAGYISLIIIIVFSQLQSATEKVVIGKTLEPTLVEREADGAQTEQVFLEPLSFEVLPVVTQAQDSSMPATEEDAQEEGASSFTIYLQDEETLLDNSLEATEIHLTPDTPLEFLHEENGWVRVRAEVENTPWEGYVSRAVFPKADAEDHFLGVLSEKYESKGNPGLISNTRGDFGGKSYGAWQVTVNTGSLKAFLRYLETEAPEFHERLMTAYGRDGRRYAAHFDAAWTALGQEEFDAFYALQKEFTRISYYEKALEAAAKRGVDVEALTQHHVVRNAIWSMAVQLGANITARYLSRVDTSASPDRIVTDLYQMRIQGIPGNFKSSPTLHGSLRRRFQRELQDALRMLDIAEGRLEDAQDL